jgi:hypothetical protein
VLEAVAEVSNLHCMPEDPWFAVTGVHPLIDGVRGELASVFRLHRETHDAGVDHAYIE